MTSRVSRWMCRVSALCGVACLAWIPQGPEDLDRAIARLTFDVDNRTREPGSHSAVQEMLARHAALRTRLLAAEKAMPACDIARNWTMLCSAAACLQRDPTEVLADLEHAMQVVRARDVPMHGLPLLLRRATEIQHDHGSAAGLEGDWLQLVEQWPADARNMPKRCWLAAVAARQMTSRLSRPATAIELLDRAIVDAERTEAWDTGSQLVADMDLWITGTSRPMAGSRDDCLGELYELRGFAHGELGQLRRAIEDLHTARGFLEKSGNQHLLANVQHDLAGVWLQLGRTDQAIQAARYARKRYEAAPWGDRNPSGVDDNGVRAMQKVEAWARLRRRGADDLPEAGALLMSIVGDEKFRAWPGETNVDAWLAWGELLLAEPSPMPAGPQLADALRGIRTFCRTRGPWRVLAQADLLEARWLLQQERPEEALPLLQSRLDESDFGLRVQQQCLVGRARLSLQQPPKAMAAYRAAGALVADAVARERLWLFDGATSDYQRAYDEALRGAIAAYRSLIAADPGTSPTEIEVLYEILQQFHGYEAACLMSAAGFDLDVSRLDAEERRRFYDGLNKQKELRGNLGAAQRVAREQGIGGALRRRLQTQMEAVETDLAAVRAAHADGTTPPRPANLRAVQEALQPHELLLECVDLGDSIAAFCITHERTELVELVAPSDCQDLRTAATELGNRRTGDAEALVARLGGILLRSDGALARQLVGVRTLLVSPEGPLCRVPFAALPFADGRLAAKVAVGHAVSGSVLVHQRARAPAEPVRTDAGGLLALGNPRYPGHALTERRTRSAVDLGDFGALPATAREVLQIAQLFASPVEGMALQALGEAADYDGEQRGGRFCVLLGSAATESALAPAALRDVKFLHLACHGRADLDAPSLSFLALSLADGDPDPDEGLLRVAEFGKLRGDYELLALSACDTGSGAIRGHEGPASLARAAYAAGARRVLATLWPVEDKAASDLVVRFYELWLRDGKPAAEALAFAQDEAAAAGVPVRHWAAFTLWGEPR